MTDFATDQCLIKGDASQFETALVNIAVNGRDAMQGQGTLAITVKRLLGAPSRQAHPEVHGDVIAVAISDNGPGIPSDKLEQIFEPFYTNKEAGGGTGLGLSQVFNFAKEAGGSVRVESEVDRCMTVVLSALRRGRTDSQSAAPGRCRHSCTESACIDRAPRPDRRDHL